MAILIVAGTARLFALGRIPDGVWHDEAVNGLEGVNSALTGHFPLFYAANYGREGLFINMVGWSERAFGVTPFALRLPAALAGIATVFFIFLLADELYSRRTALFAAWFSATAFWPVLISRIAFRAVLAPLCLTAALYFAVAAARRRNWLPWTLAAGIFCGLGFHTYPTYRVAVLLLICIFAADLHAAPAKGTVVRRWLVLAATAAAVALPIFVYFAQHRGAFLSRSGALVFDSGHPAVQVIYGIGVAVRMFVLSSDLNWRHNLSGAPEFAWPLALFFLAGAAVTFWRLRARRQSWQWLPWAWMVIGLIPCAITFEIPHAVRASIAMPAALLLCALGADALMKACSPRALAAHAVIVVALAAGAGELARYFLEYAPLVAATKAFVPRDAAIARALNAQPPAVQRYVIVPQGAYFQYAIRFGTYGHPAPELLTMDVLHSAGDLHSRFPRGAIIASLLPDAEVFQYLQQRGVRFHVHPSGEVPVAIIE